MWSINSFFSGANQATEFNQLIKPLLSQPRADRRPSLDIFLYWSFSPKSSPPVYVWSFRLAFFTHRTKYCCLWLEEALYSRILFTSCVNIDISKDLQFSLPKISRSNGIVHFLLFYISSGTAKQSAIHIHMYVSVSARNWSVVLTHSAVLTFLQI